MAVTQKGIGVVWGVGNLTFTGITIETLSKIQSYDFTRDGDSAETKDAEGDTVGEQFYNRKRTFNISVIPSAATLATAKTNLHTLLPASGAVVTFADADAVGTPIELSGGGNTSAGYVVISSKLGRSNTGAATVDMTLKAYDANDVSVTISS